MNDGRSPHNELKPLADSELRANLAKLRKLTVSGRFSVPMLRLMLVEVTDIENELRRRESKRRPNSDALAAGL